jgi:hypothetical protein
MIPITPRTIAALQIVAAVAAYWLIAKVNIVICVPKPT